MKQKDSATLDSTDLQKVYSTPEGKCVVDYIVSISGLLHEPARGEAYEAFLARRSIGLCIYNKLNKPGEKDARS